MSCTLSVVPGLQLILQFTVITKCKYFHVDGTITVSREGLDYIKVVDNLPETLRSQLICMYGEKYDEDCDGLSDEVRQQFCQTIRQINPRNKCHARSWDRYDFEIKLQMKTSNAWSDASYSTVILEADDYLRNITFHLRGKDHIWFTGSMNRPETIGSDVGIRIAVDEIGCIYCENKSLTSQKRQKTRFCGKGLATVAQNGIKRVLNFIFYPVAIFR